MAIAMQWVSRITTVSLTMALPALGGVLLDGFSGTSPWLLIVGAVLGFAAAMSQLLKMAANQTSSNRKSGGQASGRDEK